LRNSFHSDGWFRWALRRNSEVDCVLDEARSIAAAKQRTELYQEDRRIASEEAIKVFLRAPDSAAEWHSS
jgi:hypothetical protein